MSEFTRVRDKASGHEYSLATTVAEHTDGVEILKDEAATDTNGRPLPPKYAAPKELSDMTVSELQTEAERRNVDLGGATKKADIISTIQAAPTTAQEV